MSKPGVMLYFDIRNCLKRLNTQQKGILFEAILEYGEFGTVPDFSEDTALGVAWDFIEPKIDRDDERYEANVLQRKYAAYCKSCKRIGIAPQDFTVWQQRPHLQRSLMDGEDTSTPEELLDDGKQRPLSNDNGPHPTTTPTPTATSKTDTAGGTHMTLSTAVGTHHDDFETLRKARIASLKSYK